MAAPGRAGPDDVFCSGNTVGGFNDGWVAASMTVVARVPTSRHRVRVLANSIAAGAVLRLDDPSLTVDH